MPRRPRLLVINPNTSPLVTQTIDALAREVAGEAAEVTTVTAAFGYSYLMSRAATSIAAHAVLDSAASALASGFAPDAAVIGCFGDPGLVPLAELLDLPVAGFAEAGLLAAAELPGKYTIAVSGNTWCAMLGELVDQLGIADKVAAIVPIDGYETDPAALAEFVTRQARATGAERIVLGGAGLIPIIPAVVAAARVPVIDPHRQAIRKALRLAQAGGGPASAARPPERHRTVGLSPALTQLLSGERLTP